MYFSESPCDLYQLMQMIPRDVTIFCKEDKNDDVTIAYVDWGVYFGQLSTILTGNLQNTVKSFQPTHRVWGR